jgi:hypothetical protein
VSATILASVLLVLAATSSEAQDVQATDERLLECDALADSAERLACFNRVVENLRPAAPPPPATDNVPAAEPVIPEAPAEPATLRPETGSEVPDVPSPAPTVVGPAVDETMPAAEMPGEIPAERMATPPPAPPESRVAEAPQPAKPAKQKQKRPTGDAVVVDVWEQVDGRFTVRLDNGEVWRETEGTRVGMPDVGASVTVTRGLFGSYRMKIEGIARVAWVRPPDLDTPPRLSQ